MALREVARLEFKDPVYGGDVFVMVRTTDGLVGLLLTGQHTGDIDVYFALEERKHLVEALEHATQIAQVAGASGEQDIVTIRFVYPDSKLEVVANVSVQQGLVLLELALKGDPDEEDDASVFMSANEARWLAEVLSNAI